MNDLNWDGIESCASDTYYDIVNGYFDEEIKCEHTRKKLKEAVRVIESLVVYLGDNDLVV